VLQNDAYYNGAAAELKTTNGTAEQVGGSPSLSAWPYVVKAATGGLHRKSLTLIFAVFRVNTLNMPYVIVNV
jgi:hypothetical protein